MDQNGHEGRTASPCQISLKSLKLRTRYSDLSIFQNNNNNNNKVDVLHVRLTELHAAHQYLPPASCAGFKGHSLGGNSMDSL